MAEKTQNLQTKKVFADLFGLSTRRIDQLREEGIIEGSGKPTRYDLFPTVKAYIAYLSNKANAREQKKTVAELTEQKLAAEVDLKQAKAEAAQLQLAELQGKMHRAEDVEAIVTAHVMYVRSLIMALPGKLAVDCANLTTSSEVAERIKREAYDILDALASFSYDKEAYRKLVQERQGWESREDGNEEDAGE